ncbi:MAG: hypothetical protein Q7T03_06960 [Deltaproteobacteria bacterium]|nr:hypothetical protein [Deltaproteobacteria bacterium]
MSKKIATLVLNRNLKSITDTLVEHLQKFDGDVSDLYVIESGSALENCSKYKSYRADWTEAVEEGLRYPRGFNFGLSSLLRDGKYEQYDYFFLVCNDSLFMESPTVGVLAEEMSSHSRIGILSPCDASWGEYRIIPENQTRMFWYGNHIAWMVRRTFIDQIREMEKPDHLNFLYDGSNFRGYYLDVELIGKAYANNFCYATTRKAMFREEANLKERFSYIMRTDKTEENQDKMFLEGSQWLRKKYGFQSHWNMLRYVKSFYDQFLENNPEYLRFKT